MKPTASSNDFKLTNAKNGANSVNIARTAGGENGESTNMIIKQHVRGDDGTGATIGH